MEFPHLDRHCSLKTCNQLDFLPVKCFGCGQIFCSSHYSYDQHKCPTPQVVNFQVPVCPLCDQPLSMRASENPNVVLSQHMDNKCQLNVKKIYTNKCGVRGCKLKTMIKISCKDCHNSFCLRHRHPADHTCDSLKPLETQKELRRAKLLAACMARQVKPEISLGKNVDVLTETALLETSQPLPSPTSCRQQELEANDRKRTLLSKEKVMPDDLTDDEALAYALWLSQENEISERQDNPSTSNQTGKAR